MPARWSASQWPYFRASNLVTILVHTSIKNRRNLSHLSNVQNTDDGRMNSA